PGNADDARAHLAGDRGRESAAIGLIRCPSFRSCPRKRATRFMSSELVALGPRLRGDARVQHKGLAHPVHSRASGNPDFYEENWVPAFAGTNGVVMARLVPAIHVFLP